MTDSQKILEMIESVDVSNSNMLDEIDLRSHCYVKKWKVQQYPLVAPFKGAVKYTDGVRCSREDGAIHTFRIKDFNAYYTRSRDALKSIRPDGWSINIEPRFFCGYNDELLFYAHAVRPIGTTRMECFDNFTSPVLSTEELAELHAIIQAIEWERRNE